MQQNSISSKENVTCWNWNAAPALGKETGREDKERQIHQKANKPSAY